MSFVKHKNQSCRDTQLECKSRSEAVVHIFIEWFASVCCLRVSYELSVYSMVLMHWCSNRIIIVHFINMQKERLIKCRKSSNMTFLCYFTIAAQFYGINLNNFYWFIDNEWMPCHAEISIIIIRILWDRTKWQYQALQPYRVVLCSNFKEIQNTLIWVFYIAPSNLHNVSQCFNHFVLYLGEEYH